MSFATKQDRVAEILREGIIIGTYRRGGKLKQADLAQELGVSITPVREALHTLEAEGYIVGLPHKGLLVPELVPEETQEIFELRLMLERELTERALANLSQRGLQELKDLQRSVERSIESGNLQDIRRANYRFHFKLYEEAKRPQTLHFVRVLWAKYPFTSQDKPQGRPSRMRKEHDLFLAHIDRNDVAGAVEAMVEHIRSGWRSLTAPDRNASGGKADQNAPAPVAVLPPRAKARR